VTVVHSGGRNGLVRKRVFMVFFGVLALVGAVVGIFVATSRTGDSSPPEAVSADLDLAERQDMAGSGNALTPTHSTSSDSHHVATWNMQGASHSTENKWNTGVAQMIRDYRLVSLQEAGAVPNSAKHTRDYGVGGRTVKEYTWGGTATRPGPYIYWLETDAKGNRVNLAVVSANRAEDVDVVSGPYRPALGIRIGTGYYFSVHASAGNGGGDAPTLLKNIDSAVSTHGKNDHASYTWYALGDYNREPKAGGLPFTVCPPSAPTHPATAPKKYYDYMVRNSAPQLSGHVLNIQLSDHLPDRFTFPPTKSADHGSGPAGNPGGSGPGPAGNGS
jgi:hypothetical protein